MTQVETLVRYEERPAGSSPTFKTLLMHVSNESACRERLAVVVDYARRNDAHLIGVGCALSPAVADPWLGYVDGTVLQLLMDDQKAELAKCKAHFHELAAPLASHGHWCEQADFASRSLADHAAAADLVICGPEHGPAAATADASDVVFECGLPVLMVPHGVRELRFRTILVAWRDTVEARRAVSAALPLLEKAESVVVLAVEPKEDARTEWSLNAVRQRLERHGVKCTTLTRRGSGDGQPSVILEAAREQFADLIVLGAYGHSRAREWVLGGVTKGLLNDSDIPLFLAH